VLNEAHDSMSSLFDAWARAVGDFSLGFFSLLVQAVPFLLAGSLLSALLAGLPQRLRAQGRSGALRASLTGACAALFVPACDCAAVPAARRLLRKGFSPPAAIAYLCAVPVLNPICLVSTFLAYHGLHPWLMVGLRGGGSFLIAVAAGFCCSRIDSRRLLGEEAQGDGEGAGSSAPWIRLRPIAREGHPVLARLVLGFTEDFLNVLLAYTGGAFLACLFQPLVGAWVGAAPSAVLVAAGAMVAAFVLSLCSSADAFVAVAGMPFPGFAQLAFLWAGPVINLKALLIYPSLLRPRAIVLLGALVWTMALLGTLGCRRFFSL
jgi:hypothetical protein